MNTRAAAARDRRPTNVHGAIALDPAACTSCNLCVVECPTWCIQLEAHAEQQQGPGRAKVVKVLDEFSIDYGLCMYCGICVQVCPFDALTWVSESVPVAESRSGVVAGIAELSGMWPDSPGDADADALPNRGGVSAGHEQTDGA